jgi:hypothetical protein
MTYVSIVWRRAAGRLHERSLNQLLREKLATEEDMGILAYDEPDSPAILLSIFDYGDLLHWGNRGGERRALQAWEADEFTGGDRRLAFLAAATALAHVYMGFAVLADVAANRSS